MIFYRIFFTFTTCEIDCLHNNSSVVKLNVSGNFFSKKIFGEMVVFDLSFVIKKGQFWLLFQFRNIFNIISIKFSKFTIDIIIY